MLSPDYDSNMILHTLLTLAQEKKLHTERLIAALKYLMLVGAKSSINGALYGLSLDDLGRTLLDIRYSALKEHPTNAASVEDFRQFTGELSVLISEFGEIDETMLHSSTGDAEIQKIFELSNRYLGADSPSFMLGLFMSVLGDGTITQVITEQLTPAHGRAVIQYMIEHPQLLYHNLSASSSENKKKYGGINNEKGTRASFDSRNNTDHGGLWQC